MSPRVAGYILMIVSAAVMLAFCAPLVLAHSDDHQMGIDDPEVRTWYRQLMQPDNPTISCCGEADAWWTDAFGCVGDECYAEITDTRDDAPLGRRHIEPGTRITVPRHKYNRDNNPTGHGVIFIGPNDNVLCYIVPGGV